MGKFTIESDEDEKIREYTKKAVTNAGRTNVKKKLQTLHRMGVAKDILRGTVVKESDSDGDIEYEGKKENHQYITTYHR